MTCDVPHLAPKDRPASRIVSNGNRELLLDWQYTYPSSIYDETHRITIPAGTRYRPSVPDIASIVVPERVLWVASLPHDLIYRYQGRVSQFVERQIEVLATGVYPWVPVHTVSRRYADLLFHRLVCAIGASAWRARLAYWAVRSPFGWAAWRETDDVIRDCQSRS